MFSRQEHDAVERVMNRGILSGYKGAWCGEFYGGPEIRALENEIGIKFGSAYNTAVNSATSGLWACLNAIGIKPGDEVIVTPWSMTCSASLPLLFGAVPVFADIEPDFYCLDPKDVKLMISSRTKAIIVVDLFGMPYAADEINDIAHSYGIPVIEDAAQAIGAKYRGNYTGTLADFGVYSFNVHKHIQAGEGGIVTTKTKEHDMRVKLSINHAEAVTNGMPAPENYLGLIGMNLRMTELCAAIIREQLKKLDAIIEQYQSYGEQFAIPVRPGCTSAFYKFARRKVLTISGQYADLFNFKNHYITPIYKMPEFQVRGYGGISCPVCEEIEDDIILAWLKNPI
ncbi:MAG: DegT/DnrJ/EryC1/StrS family aminotransferase [Patescibacteria group bacterium]